MLLTLEMGIQEACSLRTKCRHTVNSAYTHPHKLTAYSLQGADAGAYKVATMHNAFSTNIGNILGNIPEVYNAWRTYHQRRWSS
jgi:hypothetical protein